MINKKNLIETVNKYYLNSFNPSVKWIIKDNKLFVYAGKNGKVCKIILDDFNIGLVNETKIGIFDTEQLLKLLKITDDELDINLQGSNEVYNKMVIKDKNYKLIYTLADTMILDKVSYYKDLDNYEIILNITPHDIDKLIKAQKSLMDNLFLTIKTYRGDDETPLCEFIFGENNDYSNKISTFIKGNIKELEINLPFNAEIINEILLANKNSEEGRLVISKQGLLKFEFSQDKIYSEYFVTRNE